MHVQLSYDRPSQTYPNCTLPCPTQYILVWSNLPESNIDNLRKVLTCFEQQV